MGDWKKALAASAQAAGLTEHRIHPYVLRHSFASIAATSGVPLVVAQQIMRHTSSKMLLEVYVKAGALALREGIDRFGS